MQRTILSAMFSGEIGPMTAQQLTSLQKDYWQHLRQSLTDARETGEGLQANCMACGAPVYISCKNLRGEKLPYFSHYSGANDACPWYRGRNLSPNDARALQYAGQQESNIHRSMCEKIEELVKLDRRYVSSSVDTYLPPTNSNHGRYPDVFFELRGLGKFVIEFQKSKTFQTEISGRMGHYHREGIPIIWVLFGVDVEGSVCQSFEDVIQRHRGNAFVLDAAAIERSYVENRLYLSCYLRSDDAFDSPVLVSLDDLSIPSNMAPYYEDRFIGPMIESFQKRRQPLYRAIKAWPDQGEVSEAITEATLALRPKPKIDLAFVKCIATVYSIVLFGLEREEVLVTKCTNLKSMINSLCQGPEYARYSLLIRKVLERSSQNSLLEGKVGEHLARANTDLVDPDSLQWKLVEYLFPELLGGVQRRILADFEALPIWAHPKIDF